MCMNGVGGRVRDHSTFILSSLLEIALTLTIITQIEIETRQGTIETAESRELGAQAADR